MAALRVIGGPVQSNGMLLVFDVTPAQEMELTALDPTTQSVAGRRPFSPSGIAPGESFAPQVFGSVVIDLTPAGSDSSPIVNVEGIEIRSGAVDWSYPTTGIAADPPQTCGPAHLLCISMTDPSGQSSLVELDGGSGALRRRVPKVSMSLGSNLYVATGSPTTLLQIGPEGIPVWERPAASIFGAADDDPARNWDIGGLGGLDVGSLGSSAQTGSSDPIGASETTGFSASDGHTAWTDPGSYDCAGVLETFLPPVICRFSGTIEYRGSTVEAPGLKLTIEGFDPETGRITWSQPVENALSFVTGAVAFVDPEHIVVRRNGGYGLLDLVRGTVAPVDPEQVFWCAVTTDVDVGEPPASGSRNQRSTAPEFYPCDAFTKGRAGSVPQELPGNVGTTIDGKFFWPSLVGIEATPAP